MTQRRRNAENAFHGAAMAADEASEKLQAACRALDQIPLSGITCDEMSDAMRHAGEVANTLSRLSGRFMRSAPNRCGVCSAPTQGAKVCSGCADAGWAHMANGGA